MNWTNLLYILVWIILVIPGFDLALGWLTLANTLANIAGAFLIFFIVFISVKTEAFTNFKNLFKK